VAPTAAHLSEIDRFSEAAADFVQTVRKLQGLNIEWRKEWRGRDFSDFPRDWPSDAI
jgi:hypothetical protein